MGGRRRSQLVKTADKIALGAGNSAPSEAFSYVERMPLDSHNSGDRHVAIEHRTIECVEIYVPKNVENLSELYRYLREKMMGRDEATRDAAIIDGFSLYEVDGAFYGDQIYEERTLVIRLLLLNDADTVATALDAQVATIGREIATAVARNEQELWICRCPQQMMIFRQATAVSRQT
jgi:hypothetical protein